LSSTPQPSSSSGGDGGDDDDNDGDEEEEGNEHEVESTDEGLEYNSRVVMYPIDVMSAPRN
jgi:hypothetical protein